MNITEKLDFIKKIDYLQWNYQVVDRRKTEQSYKNNT